jgi:hypothetical protein
MTSFLKPKARKNIDLNIDVASVEAKFKLPKTVAPKNTSSTSSTDALTKLLNITAGTAYETFIDDNKRTRRIIVSAPPQLKCTLSFKTDIPCYWDSHKFDTLPIGCPIKLEKDEDGKVCYITDGVFCSFSCCYSFIRDKLKTRGESHTYRESINLLNQLYKDIFGKYPRDNDITRAPHWRLLFNKDMTIEEFRASLQSSHIISTGNMNVPICKSMGVKYEEVVKF